MTTAPPVPAPDVALARPPGSVRLLWLVVVVAVLVALTAASVAVGSLEASFTLCGAVSPRSSKKALRVSNGV